MKRFDSLRIVIMTNITLDDFSYIKSIIILFYQFLDTIYI